MHAKKLIVIVSLLLSGQVRAEDLKPWTISVKVYKHRPETEFKQLDSVAVLASRETGKGFLNRTSVFREDFSFGASFCMLIDYRIDKPERERARILNELAAMDAGNDVDVSFDVSNPADCFASN